jgi:DMSO reductase anchor subunit
VRSLLSTVLWGGPSVAPVASSVQKLEICYHPLRSMESAPTDRYRAPQGALSPPIIKSIRRWMVVLWGGPSVALAASSGQTLRNCYHPLRSMKLAQTDRYRASKGALAPTIIKSIRRWMVVLWGGPSVASVASSGQTLKNCYHPLRSMKWAQTDRYRASKGALAPTIIKSIRPWMVVLWGGPSVALAASSGQTLRNCYHPLRSMESAQTDRYRAPQGALSPPIIKSIRRWMVFDGCFVGWPLCGSEHVTP